MLLLRHLYVHISLLMAHVSSSFLLWDGLLLPLYVGKLFDDDSTRKIYHCDDCHMCRRGKREDFFHCKNCNFCIGVSLRNGMPFSLVFFGVYPDMYLSCCMMCSDHECKVQNSLHSNCPICHQFMFTSLLQVSYYHTSHPTSPISLCSVRFRSCLLPVGTHCMRNASPSM
jgi:hypothetical protein